MNSRLKTTIVAIMAIWQAVLAISAFIIVQVCWWVWLAIGYMVALLIIAIINCVLEDNERSGK